MLIVAAGARRDMGQTAAAIQTLEVPELTKRTRADWLPRLRYAYADALAEAGRTEDALIWFHRAAGVDQDGSTGAAERAAELEGLQFTDLDDEDDYVIQEVTDEPDDLTETTDDLKEPADEVDESEDDLEEVDEHADGLDEAADDVDEAADDLDGVVVDDALDGEVDVAPAGAELPAAVADDADSTSASVNDADAEAEIESDTQVEDQDEDEEKPTN